MHSPQRTQAAAASPASAPALSQTLTSSEMDGVRQQIEGGIVYGLSAALHGAITLEKGRVMQSNFHDYAPLRFSEMPQVEVHIVTSSKPPTGIGEPGTPPIAPAVANAVFALTGKRLRRMPFDQEILA